jgi:hypothetical protein
MAVDYHPRPGSGPANSAAGLHLTDRRWTLHHEIGGRPEAGPTADFHLTDRAGRGHDTDRGIALMTVMGVPEGRAFAGIPTTRAGCCGVRLQADRVD